MSFNWLLVRGAGADPGALKFAALMNKQSIAENEIFSPEKRDPDTLAAHTDDLVLVRDPFDFEKLQTVTNKFYGPFEPDGTNLKYWCMFNHIAGHMVDMSMSRNFTIPHGNPKLIAGPDDGVKGGVIMSAVNLQGSPVMDYYQVLDTNEMKVSALTTGFSVYIAFVVENDYTGGSLTYTSRGIKALGIKTPGIKVGSYSTATPAGDQATVAFKVDDNTATAGWWLKVGQSGELKFFVRRASVTYNFISAANKIRKGALNEVCLTYTITGNVLTMRINNEVQTDSANETPTFPTGHSIDLWIGVGVNQNTEFMEGIMKDLRWYRNYIFTSQEQQNIWNNKRSISPIEFGKIAVAGHAFFNEAIYGPGYDIAAFDTTGFDAT